MRSAQCRVGWLAMLLAASVATAQNMPRLQAVFPAGGSRGSQVELVLRGSLAGAEDLLVYGGGLKGTLHPRGVKVDQSARPLFQRRCATCHELRSPDNRAFSPAQWEATVDRMIKVNNADIPPADRDKIVDYLKQTAANGLITGSVTIAPDAPLGRHELRVATSNGVSTAWPFYVSDQPEQLAAGSNQSAAKAQPLTPPAIVNGSLGKGGERHYFSLDLAAGQRVVFHVLAFRLSEENQGEFNPCIFLRGPDGRLLARDYGRDALDPILDLVIPKAGKYTLELRDLLFRGGPAAVYRLEIGELGIGNKLFPRGGQRGRASSFWVTSENYAPRVWSTVVPTTLAPGLRPLVTPFGVFPFHVTDYAEYNPARGTIPVLKPPCVINGRLARKGELARYLLAIDARSVQKIDKWSVIGPFPGAEALKGLDLVFPPERDLLGPTGFRAGAGYFANGRQLAWEPKEANGEGLVSFGDEAHVVHYAYATFNSDTERDVTLALGSDDGSKVWLNRQLISVYRGQRPAMGAGALVRVHLLKGANSLLFKVLNVTGPSGFRCTVNPWSVEVYAQRLGSTLKPRVRLGLGTKWLADARRNDSGDARVDWSFAEAGSYGIQVEASDDEPGTDGFFRLEVGPLTPEFSLEAFPANPSVPRGGRVPVAVVRTGLSGYFGDIKLRATDLPPGLRCADTVLGPDADHALLLLEADENAAPGHSAFQIIGSAPAVNGSIDVNATSLDHYKLQNNDLIPLHRLSLGAALLASHAPYTVDAEPKQVTFAPNGRVRVTVRVTRAPGFNGEVLATVWGLPLGMRVETVNLQPGRDTAEIDFRWPGNLYLGCSDAPGAYRLVGVGIAGGDGLTGGMLQCSAPIAVLPGEAKDEPKSAEPARPTPPGSPDAGVVALYQRRCGSCHTAFDPKVTRKTPEQWGQTVERMVQQNNARLNEADRAAILAYLRGATK